MGATSMSVARWVRGDLGYIKMDFCQVVAAP